MRALCLQCKEVALIHSEGILAGEMKHGPLALVDEHLPIVVVATRDSMYSKMNSVIQQLLARNARLMIVCTEGDDNMKQYVKDHDCQLIEVRWCDLWQLVWACLMVTGLWGGVYVGAATAVWAICFLRAPKCWIRCLPYFL